MFYDLTLLKDGAFIMCEDASEYDENVPVVDNGGAVVAQAKEMAQENPAYDPVQKLYFKMGKYYDMIKSLYSYPLNLNDPQEAFESLNSVSNMATEIINKIRMCEVKLTNMVIAFDKYKFKDEPAMLNLGMLVKNKEAIAQAGFNRFEYNVTSFFMYTPYNVSKLLAYLKLHEYGSKNLPISIDTIIGVADWDKGEVDIYNDTTQLFDVMFDDVRRMRAERHKTHSIKLSKLIDNTYQATAYHIHSHGVQHHRSIDYYASTMKGVIKGSSHVLRNITVSIGELQCDLLNSNDTDLSAKYSTVLKNAIIALTDLFYVAMIDLNTKAYTAKEHMDKRTCLEEYINNIKAALRT